MPDHMNCEWLESRSPWVSVKERLPKHDNDVLMVVDGVEGKFIYIGHYNRWWWLDDSTTYNVTHWQPLPEPPETIT
jgi:hypothetical protein